MSLAKTAKSGKNALTVGKNRKKQSFRPKFFRPRHRENPLRSA
jgi:hypothetical protein